jgi:hypothetical protein
MPRRIRPYLYRPGSDEPEGTANLFQGSAQNVMREAAKAGGMPGDGCQAHEEAISFDQAGAR